MPWFDPDQGRPGGVVVCWPSDPGSAEMIDFEFALQAWSGVAESMHAAGVDSALPSQDSCAESRKDGEGGWIA